ncbi:MAG: hypothetical protein HUU32_12490 [Calditrichaceae bacterium]|nr:hypothetical protein [Calditrichia bacterium]NUQ42207.1 hypothetical protein [Calditrichaceae bacterium]
MRLIRRRIILFLGLAALTGCGGASRFVVPEPPPADCRPVPAPESREINLAGDNVDKLFILPIQRFFDISRHVRSLSGNPRQALNTDAFDEVFNSSWFTNRNARQRLSLNEIARGPDTGTGPDTSGFWTVVRAKAQGVTPGFSIQDSRGGIYLLKFDPPGYPELATGAEVVSTKLFHAAGYNVPENYLVYFHPNILRLGEEVKFTDQYGKNRFMNEEDLAKILSRIEKSPDGRIRAVASKYLPGKPLGSFKYAGVRKDDPNDLIRHEHRRELRGLKVMAAWLNHFDTKAGNSLDMYVPEGYVRHYLIDFGSTLGSQGDEPMPGEVGHEGAADPDKVFKTIGSLGIYKRHWERERNIQFPSIGFFESQDFQPQKYRYILPNPAFMNATGRDHYWGAKLVMSFTEEQIRAAVAQGQYSDPRAAEYLVRTLVERRDIVGRYCFSRVPPLDEFHLQNSASGDPALCFTDLAVQTGLENLPGTTYECELRQNGRIVSNVQLPGEHACIPLPREEEISEQGEKEAALEMKIRVRRGLQGNWSNWMSIYIAGEASGQYRLLGVRR